MNYVTLIEHSFLLYDRILETDHYYAYVHTHISKIFPILGW